LMARRPRSSDELSRAAVKEAARQGMQRSTVPPTRSATFENSGGTPPDSRQGALPPAPPLFFSRLREARQPVEPSASERRMTRH
jgi:hypothetical protein